MQTLQLSRTSCRIAGILLLSIVAIESGGLYLTRVASGAVELTSFQVAFSRAGHAHAGVLVTLSLIALVLADATSLGGVSGHLVRAAIPVAAIGMSAGFFLSSMGEGRTSPNGLVVVLWLGAACLTIGVVALGLALLRTGFSRASSDVP